VVVGCNGTNPGRQAILSDHLIKYNKLRINDMMKKGVDYGVML
jgi:hypothetical protein